MNKTDSGCSGCLVRLIALWIIFYILMSIFAK